MAIDVFTKIFERIDTAIVQNIANGTANLANALSPLFLSCFTFYVLWVFFSYWQGSSAESTMVDITKRFVSWGIILGLGMNLQGYNETVLPLVANLGDNLSQIFSGSPTSNASALDALATQLLDAIDKNMEETDSLTMPFGIGEYLRIVANNTIILICFAVFLVIAAAYIVLAKVFLAILAVLGPVFITFALFPATRNLTSQWAMQVLNYSLFMLFINITGGIFLSYLSESMQGADFLDDATILHALLSTLMFVIILLKLPELASGLSGGIAANGFGNLVSAVSTVTRAVGGMNKTKIGAKGTEQGGKISKVK